MTLRSLVREEIERIWTVDRSEIIENIYRHDQGTLVLQAAPFHMTGWPPGAVEENTPLLYDLHDRGGLFFGAFEGDTLIGIAVLEAKRVATLPDLVQLVKLYVSRDHRNRGIGRTLVEQALAHARALGATGLYISATPSEYTVRFYQRLGAVLLPKPDPDLFALEPADIHLELKG